MKYANGSEAVMTYGPWAQLKAVRKCICPDGVGRYAEITGQPDTFFSIPARVRAFGKTVSGIAHFLFGKLNPWGSDAKTREKQMAIIRFYRKGIFVFRHCMERGIVVEYVNRWLSQGEDFSVEIL